MMHLLTLKCIVASDKIQPDNGTSFHKKHGVLPGK